MKKPETNSIITSMNKIVLRKKLKRVRLLAVLKNFPVEFLIHGQAIRRCITMGIKKITPNTSCNGKPVILGERSKIKMIRSAVSKQIINLLRGDVIIPLLLVSCDELWMKDDVILFLYCVSCIKNIHIVAFDEPEIFTKIFISPFTLCSFPEEAEHPGNRNIRRRTDMFFPIEIIFL